MAEELVNRLNSSRAVLLGDLMDETGNAIIRETLSQIAENVGEAAAEITRLAQRVEELEAGLTRISSPEAFSLPFMPDYTSNEGRELEARMDYAKAILKKEG